MKTETELLEYADALIRNTIDEDDIVGRMITRRIVVKAYCKGYEDGYNDEGFGKEKKDDWRK